MSGGRILVAGLLGAALAADAGAATVSLTLRQHDGTPLAGAVLAALPLDRRDLPPAAAAVMDQRQRRFVPQILPVQTHARVTFPNSDDVSHHVYSFSTARRFQLYLTKGEPPKEVEFDRAGVVTLGCNLHDWMLGYILVLDTPYFTQTDGAGQATLAGLPAGRYRLEVWHPRIADPAASLTREAALAESAALPWALDLVRAVLPARDQKPGFSQY